MAPALVKHTASKESNSIGKKLLKLNCMPGIDIVCVDKLSKHRVFAKEILKSRDSIAGFNKFDNFNCETMPLQNVDGLESKQETINSNPEISCVTLHNTEEGNFNVVPNVNTSEKVTQESNSKLCSSSGTSSLNAMTSKTIRDKHTRVGLKVFDIEDNMCRLNKRLRNFQLQCFSSHIAVNSFKKNYHAENDVIDVVSTDKLCKHEKLLSNRLNGNLKIFNQLSNERLNNVFKLNRGYDAVSPVLQQDTDDEGEYDYKARVPLSRGKKRSEHSPPSSSDLYKWKQKRTEIGAKCSWLSIQMADLDKKISSVTLLHNELKANRIASRKPFTSTNTKVKNNGLTERSGNLYMGAPEEHVGGCCRVQPIAPSIRPHKYVSLKDCNKSSVFSDIISTGKWNNHKQLYNNGSSLSPELLDLCYHPSLSYKSDTSLSLLLEETLRNERINTKVTVTKSTKKKKKQKSRDQPLSSQTLILDKHKNVDHISSHVKSRSKSSKTDDYSRKRPHAESLGRLRKIRKFSDSFNYDSSKPSTPTNDLSSPSLLGQSLPTQGFFPAIKQKKKTSSGDFDINNIVIPYSMAAATRVERIQYKEIPTPGWRNIWSDLNLENGIEDWECTDDELYLERHDRCEIEEQKRFTDYFVPANRRQRHNRSSECCISEPPSPCMLDEIRSNVTTPVDSPSGMSNSTKLANRLANITQCMDSERDVTWTNRRFPLCDSDAKRLDPIPSPILTSFTDASVKPVSSYSFRHSPYTLLSSSTSKSSPRDSAVLNNAIIADSSSNTHADEIEDKSWTVKLLNEPNIDVSVANPNDKHRKGIVLKLAKK